MRKNPKQSGLGPKDPRPASVFRAPIAPPGMLNRTVQAKPDPGRRPASHVQAAIGRTQVAAVQPKGNPTGVREPAPHVQAAVAGRGPVAQLARQSLITNYGTLTSGQDARQPLITNFLHNVPQTFEQALERPTVFGGFHPEADVEISKTGNTFSAKVHGIGVGDLTIYEDGSGAWINNIGVKSSLHGRGIGSRLVQAAVKAYGAVYASTANKMQEDNYSDDEDTRHLSVEGAALVRSCIRKGIMKQEWLKYPYSQF